MSLTAPRTRSHFHLVLVLGLAGIHLLPGGIPGGYDGKAAIPAVIMLHGGGGTARAAMGETGWTAKADEAGFLAVFPEATGPGPRAPGSFAGNPQTWNDGSGRFHSGSTNIDDVGFISALLDDLISRFAVDGRRIFVTGFSNGASMAHRVGAELSGRSRSSPSPAWPIRSTYRTGERSGRPAAGSSIGLR